MEHMSPHTDSAPYRIKLKELTAKKKEEKETAEAKKAINHQLPSEQSHQHLHTSPTTGRRGGNLSRREEFREI